MKAGSSGLVGPRLSPTRVRKKEGDVNSPVSLGSC